MQIAQKLDVPSPNTLLESISLNRLIVSTSESSFNQTKFRVGIYNKDDQTGGPGKELNTQNIEVENKLSENIEVNLKPYKIELPAGDFFVVITYIKDTYNERFTKMTADSIILKNFKSISTYCFLSALYCNVINKRSRNKNLGPGYLRKVEDLGLFCTRINRLHNVS